MTKREHEQASAVAGTLATQTGQRIVQAGGGGLSLTVPGGGTYAAKALRGPGRSRVIELRRNGVLIDGRVLGDASRRVIEARRAFLSEFEDLMRSLPDLIRTAHDMRRVELLGRRQRGARTDHEAVESALDAARRHGIDANV